MFNEVAEAIERQDYHTADQLLKQLKEDESDNPWLDYYQANLDEVLGNLETAKEIYKELLRQTTNRKIISQARQGIERITKVLEEQQQKEKAERLEALAQAKTEAGSQEQGILVLESIPPELKQQAAQKFARIMEIDPYTARLQLPSRSWRLYRTGAVGEMNFYRGSLNEAEIPCFSAALADIEKISVYQAKYFESIAPHPIIIYETKKGRPEAYIFEWSDVSARVEGLIPIFEQRIEMDAKRKPQTKTKTLDYVQFCDLHLKSKGCIVRFCDQNYEFTQGYNFASRNLTERTTTNRDNWNNLMEYFRERLPDIPIWSEFTPFAETAIDFREILRSIQSHIELMRREDSPWDAAFQLYSGLILIRPD